MLKPILSTLIAFLLSLPLLADDSYFSIPLPSLTLADNGKLPDGDPTHNNWNRMESLRPYATLDGPGEAYFHIPTEQDAPFWPIYRWSITDTLLTVKSANPGPISGMIFIPAADWSKFVSLRFSIPADSASPDAREPFLRARLAHYERLHTDGIPGAAWFRYQADLTRADLTTLTNANIPEGVAARRPFSRNDTVDIDDTYNLFTGGRAVSENLQLPRGLPPEPAADPNKPAKDETPVLLDSIEGITVASFNWKSLLAASGKPSPTLDPLASAIPHDQHAVFLPSFDALMTILDETSEDGLPIFRSLQPRSEDARLIERYERQLCLSRTMLARLFGSTVIRSVAVTGSDPYFPTGTDVAILFQPPDPSHVQGSGVVGLKEILTQQAIAAGLASNAKRQSGTLDGINYEGVVSPDRSISSYVAKVGDFVVVTNSLAQLSRLAAVQTKATPSLASLDEFSFFRSRYPAGKADETAFLFLSDATIRRWCGPEWRIATSRRLRAGAIMADLTAAHATELVTANIAEPRPLNPANSSMYVPMSTIGDLTLGPAGVASSVYGHASFLTPIAELNLKEVTPAEASAYKRWRDTYQRNWDWAFDPIGLSLSLTKQRASADLTVMPLIVGSDYAMWISAAQGATIAPQAGDPHDALAHVIAAINIESPAVQNAAGMARMFAPGVKIDPLGWLGQSISIYADPDPFWADMLAAGDTDDFFDDNAHRLPVALHAEVGSALKLTAFVAAARSFIEQSSPGMTAWEPREHNGQQYVRVGLSESAKAEAGDSPFDQVSVYYAATPRALILSLNENVLKRALDRQAQRRAAAAEPANQQPAPDGAAPTTPTTPPNADPYWLGTSMGLRFTDAGLALTQGPGGEAYRRASQLRAWSNIPILNEWKRAFPDKDPAAIHELLFGTRLLSPGVNANRDDPAASYTWNDAFHTMESTTYGHPGEPKPGPVTLGPLESIRAGNLGLTFEENGLRARAVLDRK